MKPSNRAAQTFWATLLALSVIHPLRDGARAQGGKPGAGTSLQGQSPEQSPLTSAPLMRQRSSSGLNVAPVFEGWEPNPDGTFSLYFGYMNRNWEEELDIPIGPNNFFAPEPQDRGQPTHFLPRREKRVFAVAVPKDFGNKTLVWTLSIRGKTDQVPGSLKPSHQIEVSKDTTSSTPNTPPKLAVGPDQTIVFPQPATLRVTVSDDGIGGREGGRSVSRLTVEWRKYRGPGRVTFTSSTPAVPPDPRRLPAPPPDVLITDGKGVVTATFSEPGVYVLQALADDGSMFDAGIGAGVPGRHCCWTTVLASITVKPGRTPVSQR